MHQMSRRTFLSWSTAMLASMAVSGCGSLTNLRGKNYVKTI